jgi:hypothetical protein
MAVDAKPCVVNDYPWPPVELVLDSHRGEAEVGAGQGAELAQREHDPKPGGNEVGKFAPEEVLVHTCGWVCPPCCVARELFGGPGRVVELDVNAVVADFLEVGAGRVWDAVDARGQVGLPTDGGDELSPGWCASKFSRKRVH